MSSNNLHVGIDFGQKSTHFRFITSIGKNKSTCGTRNGASNHRCFDLLSCAMPSVRVAWHRASRLAKQKGLSQTHTVHGGHHHP